MIIAMRNMKSWNQAAMITIIDSMNRNHNGLSENNINTTGNW